LDEEPTVVSPYCSAPSPSTLTSLTLHPAFDITNSATTLLLTSQPDLPIRLTNALDLAYTHASYTWQNNLTEAYISPASLLFVDNDHFVAGAKDSLAVFNIHNQDAPVYEAATRKGRKARKLYGADAAGIGGIVSSLALSCDNILAAGTYNRQVGLFENAGQGQSIAAFDLSFNDADDSLLKGNGVSQLAWSPCGNYLFVAERQSDALLVYDIRHTGQRLSYLAGRKAHTTLKLSFDLVTDEYGKTDVWAGGTDGKVRAWRDVTSREGRIEPDLVHQVSQGKRLVSPNHVLLILTTDSCREQYNPQSARANAHNHLWSTSQF
jgi:WD40 repeat protein